MTGKADHVDRAAGAADVLPDGRRASLLIWFFPELVTWLPRADEAGLMAVTRIDRMRTFARRCATPFARARHRAPTARAITRIEYLPLDRARAGAATTTSPSARCARSSAISTIPSSASRVPLAPRGTRVPATRVATRSPTIPVGAIAHLRRSRARRAHARRARSAGAAAPTASRSSFRAIASSAAMGSLGGFMNARRRRSASRSSAGC